MSFNLFQNKISSSVDGEENKMKSFEIFDLFSFTTSDMLCRCAFSHARTDDEKT